MPTGKNLPWGLYHSAADQASHTLEAGLMDILAGIFPIWAPPSEADNGFFERIIQVKREIIQFR